MESMSRRAFRHEAAWWLAVAMFVAAPAVARAHPRSGAAGGFLSGFSHPISGWDHILAMIAVGLWGAQLGAPAMWLLPVTFPMVMALGGTMGLLGIPLPGVELGIAASAIVLGAMVLTEGRPRLWIAALIVGVFAVFHGHAHGTELSAGHDALLYSAGFVIATGCLHGVGIAIGLIHKWRSGRTAIRAAGAFVALAGLYFAWRALA
jgi:urease accessory protein